MARWSNRQRQRYRPAEQARLLSRVGTLSRSHTVRFTEGGTGAGHGGGAATMVLTARTTGTGAGHGGGFATMVLTARGEGTGAGHGGGYGTFPPVLVHIRPSPLDLLLLDVLSRRQETVRFDLLDASNKKIGTLAVDRDHPPTITNDGNRRIRRQLSNVVISPTDLNDVDTITERLRPVWVLGEGGPGYEFNLGIMLWADASRMIESYGQPIHSTLHDQCLILDQPLVTTVGVSEGASVFSALIAQAAASGIVNVEVDPTDAVAGASIAWAAGRDSRLKVLESLCALAGFLPPYFDNDGVLVCRAAPDLSVAEAELVYGPGTRIISGSITASNDLLAAPNVYLAIDTSVKDAPTVGTFYVPDDAPHSVANRGFAIPKVLELQGLGSQTAADQAAQAAYASDSATYTWMSFDSTPDPRHDTFDVIEVLGTRYREQSWRLPCSAGAPMNHDARGIYQDA